jgi:hypothetical protein
MVSCFVRAKNVIFLAQKKLKKRHQMGIFRSKNLERF